MPFHHCTVICFISISAKFVIFTVVGINVEAKKYTLGKLECAYFSFKLVPFRPTTVPMPNLALLETKRITVCGSFGLIWTTEPVGQSIFLSRRRQVDIIIYYKYPIHVVIIYIAGKLRFPSVLLPTTEKFDPSHSVLERDTCFSCVF